MLEFDVGLFLNTQTPLTDLPLFGLEQLTSTTSLGALAASTANGWGSGDEEDAFSVIDAGWFDQAGNAQVDWFADPAAASTDTTGMFVTGKIVAPMTSFSGGDEPPPGGKDDEIVVTGTPLKEDGEEEDKFTGDTGTGSGTGEGTSETGGGGTGGGGGGGGGTEPDSDTPDCRDRSAVAAQDDIVGRSDDDDRELGKVIYRDSDGQMRSTPLILGDGPRILWQDILAAVEAAGISFSQITGFVHNHDENHYVTGDTTAMKNSQRDINRYPSGNDWNAADAFVRRGAGGPDGSGFALYLIDPRGAMREFKYGDNSLYREMSESARDSGSMLPPETNGAGSCG